jgi:hypothetical protein
MRNCSGESCAAWPTQLLPPPARAALGIALPLAGASAGYVASRPAGLAPGNSALLILLAASAS